MKLTLIAEGSTKWQRFIRRWGVSYLLGEDVLFDTFGDAEVFLGNLTRMKIDASKIRHIVISHDHWDHLAGLWPFLEKHKNVTVYICPGFGSETKEKLASSGVTVVEGSGRQEIKEGIYTTGPIRGIYKSEAIEEQAIVLKTAEGLSVITGCAHPGITNILDQVTKNFGQPVFVLIGGFHLKDAPQETIDKIIRALKAIGVKKVVPLHCAGAVAQAAFRRAFGPDYVLLKTRCALDVE